MARQLIRYSSFVIRHYFNTHGRILLNCGPSLQSCLAITFTLLIPTYSAKADQRTGRQIVEHWNGYAGERSAHTIQVENGFARRRISLDLTRSMIFPTESVHGVTFRATVQRGDGGNLASFSLRIGRDTVQSGLRTQSFLWANVANRTFSPVQQTFIIGFVPATLSGSISGGASVNYLLNLNPPQAGFESLFGSVSLTGQGSSFLNGTVSYEYTPPSPNPLLPGIPPGNSLTKDIIKSDLQLGRATLRSDILSTPFLMSGNATLSLNLVTINSDWLRLRTIDNGILFTQPLARYSAPARTINLLGL